MGNGGWRAGKQSDWGEPSELAEPIPFHAVDRAGGAIGWGGNPVLS